MHITNLIDQFYKYASLEEEEDELQEFLSEVLALRHDEDVKKFGKKAFLSSLFETINKYRVPEDKLSWEKFTDNLLKLHLDGRIRLARADLITAMDKDLVESSEIPYETELFHFLDEEER